MKRKIKIPHSFELGGKTITVEMLEDFMDKRQLLGEAIYSCNTITLQAPNKNPKVVTESVEQTFLHELVHWILLAMGEDDLRKNEKFVDLFAVFLHQFLKTVEY